MTLYLVPPHWACSQFDLLTNYTFLNPLHHILLHTLPLLPPIDMAFEVLLILKVPTIELWYFEKISNLSVKALSSRLSLTPSSASNRSSRLQWKIRFNGIIIEYMPFYGWRLPSIQRTLIRLTTLEVPGCVRYLKSDRIILHLTSFGTVELPKDQVFMICAHDKLFSQQTGDRCLTQ